MSSPTGSPTFFEPDPGAAPPLLARTSPEDLYRSMAYSDSIYGTLDLTDRDECFCWCFWTFEVPVETLKNAGAGAVMVRGMDEVRPVALCCRPSMRLLTAFLLLRHLLESRASASRQCVPRVLPSILLPR